MNRWIAVGCFFGFLSVVLGAFGAHALRESLDPKSLNIYQIGAQYQMYHALALAAFGLWYAQNPGASNWPGFAFSAGIILFSGSLYLLATTGSKFFGAIAPLGGLAFMAGWLLFGWTAFTMGSPK